VPVLGSERQNREILKQRRDALLAMVPLSSKEGSFILRKVMLFLLEETARARQRQKERQRLGVAAASRAQQLMSGSNLDQEDAAIGSLGRTVAAGALDGQGRAVSGGSDDAMGNDRLFGIDSAEEGDQSAAGSEHPWAFVMGVGSDRSKPNDTKVSSTAVRKPLPSSKRPMNSRTKENPASDVQRHADLTALGPGFVVKELPGKGRGDVGDGFGGTLSSPASIELPALMSAANPHA